MKIRTKIAAMLVLLVCGIVQAGSLFGSDGILFNTGGMSLDGSNGKFVKPNDNLATEYTSITNNGSMGTLSSSNRRSIIRTPGTYNSTQTLILGTDYVDILDMYSGAVVDTTTSPSMGIIVNPKKDIVVSGKWPAPVSTLAGSYSRNSIAQYEGTSYTTNQPIYYPLVISSGITGLGEYTNDGFPGGPQLIACKSGSAIYSKDGWSGGIGRSTNGTTFAVALAAAPTGYVLQNIWAADDSENLIFTATKSGLTYIFTTHYSGSALTTPALGQLGGADFAMPTGTTTNFWSMTRLVSGTMILAEYSAGSVARRVYRSADKGLTWTQVLDVGAGVIKHFHGCGQLAATGRVLLSSGDGSEGAAFNRTYYSDDDGVTWAILVPGGTIRIQPIAFFDFGHATKLMFGDDQASGIGLIDTVTGRVEQVMFDHDKRGGEFNFFTFARVGNTIYAGMAAGAAGDVFQAIYATTDLYHWNPVYRSSAAGITGPQALFNFGGVLHATVSSDTHVYFNPPATQSVKRGVLVEAAATNLLSSTSYSSAEASTWNDAGYWTCATSGISLSRVTTATAGVSTIPHGTYAVRVKADAVETLAAQVKIGTATVTQGTYVSGSIMIGAPSTGTAQYFYVNFIKTGGSNAANATVIYGVAQPGEWQTIQIPSCLVAASETPYQIYVRVDNNVNPVDILLDCAQIVTSQPTSWQVGGTARVAAQYNLPIDAAEKTTHIFTFAPKAFAYQLSGNLYVRSWRVSATTYAQLLWNNSAYTWDLYVTDGTHTETLSSAATSFKQREPITFAVQFGGAADSKVSFSIIDGRGLQNVSATTNDYTAFQNTRIMSRWGDKDAASGMNGVLYDIDVTGYITPANIATYMASKI